MGETPAIDCSALTRLYGQTAAVDSVTVRIMCGEVVALIGPNGAGKSTLVEIISGLQAPTTGVVRVFGEAPRNAVQRGTLGTMLQNGALLRAGKVSSLLKLMLGVQRHPLSLEDVIGRANLSGIVDKRVAKLSGGEAQRVRYALAIMSSPRLLILDEPTVGLDIQARHAFWEDVNSRRRAQTIVYATHHLDEADRWADRIIVMANGRVVADESPARLRESFGMAKIEFTSEDPVRIVEGSPIHRIEQSGDRVEILTSDSNEALRLIMEGTGSVRDLRVGTPSLDDALTHLLQQQEQVKEDQHG